MSEEGTPGGKGQPGLAPPCLLHPGLHPLRAELKVGLACRLWPSLPAMPDQGGLVIDGLGVPGARPTPVREEEQDD